MRAVTAYLLLLLLLAGGFAWAAELGLSAVANELQNVSSGDLNSLDGGPEESTGGASWHNEDQIITQARQVALRLVESLPNFVCREIVSRFQSDTPRAIWTQVDVVTADLTYENGKEDYRQVAINGRSTHRPMEQLRGASSMGDFGSVLAQLFSPETAASFHYRRDAHIGESAVRVYDFEVAREHAQWMIAVAQRATQPPYKGSVWIEPETGFVLRIEMQADSLPARFPADHVEPDVDYRLVQVGAQEFMLPLRAEMLICLRGSNFCARNVIDFAGYRRYGSISNVHFDNGPQ